MAKETILCPLKFTSRTLTDDGFIRKATCECEETRCGWWNADKARCVMVMLSDSFDAMQKLDKVKMRLMLASGQDKESIESVFKAYPYLEVERDIRKALE